MVTRRRLAVGIAFQTEGIAWHLHGRKNMFVWLQGRETEAWGKMRLGRQAGARPRRVLKFWLKIFAVIKREMGSLDGVCPGESHTHTQICILKIPLCLPRGRQTRG